MKTMARWLTMAAAVVAVVGCQVVSGQTWRWNVDGNGDWWTAANWIGPGGYPDGVGHVADFASFDITTQRRYIRVVDSNDFLVTVGTLLIGDNDRPYTFSNAVNSTTWVFADSDGLAEIIVSNAYSGADRPHRIDGTIALSNDLRIAVLTAPTASGLFLWGGVTQAVSGANLVMDGTGSLWVLTNVNTWSGATIVRGGRFIVATGGVLNATSEIRIHPGALFAIDNQHASSAHGNRVPDTATIRSLGGMLSFVHGGAAGVDYSETLGQLNLEAGALTITSSVAAVGQTSTLTFSSVTRSNGVVGLIATALGSSQNSIIFNTAPSLVGATHSDIVPYIVATTNGTDWVLVTHDGDGTSLRAYGTATHEAFATAEADFVNTTNARPPAGTTSLTAGRTVNALVLDNGVTITASGADRVLRPTGTGLILQTGGTSTLAPTGNYDLVLAFDTVRGIFYIVGTLDFQRADSAIGLRGTNGFIKAGPGDLILRTASQANNATVLNNLRGPISIDEGRLILRHANAAGGGVLYLNGGVLALMVDGDTKFKSHEGSGTVPTNTPLVVNASVGTVLVGRATSGSTTTHHTLGEVRLRPDTMLLVNFTNLTGDATYGLIADGLVLEGNATVRVLTGPGTGDGRLFVTNANAVGVTDHGNGFTLTVLGNDIIRSELFVRGTLNLGGDLIVSPHGQPVGVRAEDGFTNVAGNIRVGNGMIISTIDFARELGSGPGQIQFRGAYVAGLGARGGGTVGFALTSGGSTGLLTWGEGFFEIGSTLRLNEDDADATLVLWNGLDLNSTNGTVVRIINVEAGTALVAGAITNLDNAIGVANLRKMGGGILWVTNQLGHNGTTTITGGALRVRSPDDLAPGNLFISAANAAVALETSGIFTRDLGAGDGQVQLRGFGGSANNSRPGFSAYGGDLVVDLGGDGTGTGPTVQWNSPYFDPEGTTAGNTGALLLNRATADSVLYFLNPIDLNGSGEGVPWRRFEVAANVAVLGGQISNSGEGFFDPIGILKRGAGTLVLAANNTYDGVTTIEAGMLVVGTNGTAGSLGKGTVTNLGVLAFNRSNSYTVTNLITGSGELRQIGSGITVLTADNEYTGPTVISNGTLRIQGAHTGAGAITVAGGRLEGTGSVSGLITVETGATLAPGASPGIFTVNANVTLQSGSFFEVELNGLSAGTGYDQLVMGTGTTLTLNNPTLSVLLGFTPNLGDSFMVVTGFSTLSGTFNGLPNGSTFTVSGTQFQIDYNASDITLTVVPEPGTLGTLLLGAAVLLLRRRARA